MLTSKGSGQYSIMQHGGHHQPLRIMLLVLLVGCHQLVTRTTGVGAFTCVPVVVRQQQQQQPAATPLQAAVDDNDDGNKKRRKRKRKNPGAGETTSTTTMKQANSPVTPVTKKNVPLQETRTASKVIEEEELGFDQDRDNEDNPVDIDLLNDIASFKFDPNQFDATAGPPQADKVTAPGATTTTRANRGASLTLPDIKEARKLKQLEEELANKAEEEAANKVRIKRSDKEAFRKVCIMYCAFGSSLVVLRTNMVLVRNIGAYSPRATTTPMTNDSNSSSNNNLLPMPTIRSSWRKSTERLVPCSENGPSRFWAYRSAHCKLDISLGRWE
jgi:hypothetical protein